MMIPADSPQWLPARVGLATASLFPKIMARTKTGWAASRDDVKKQLVAERLTGIKTEVFVTEAMNHGIEQEAPACDLYSIRTGTILERSGLYLHPTIEFLGGSPDREIGTDGLLECKCPTSKTHLNWLIGKTLPQDYVPQMLIQLACTGRKWCEFISYDPRMPEKQQLFIARFEPTAAEIAKAEEEAALFLKEVDDLFRLVTEN